MEVLLDKIPDVTLINLPAPFLEEAMIIPPIGIAQLYSFIKLNHHEVELVDLNSISVKEDLTSAIMNRLRVIKSPIVGVSATTPQSRFLPLILAALRDPIFSVNPWIVAGGSHPTVLSEQVLNLGFDAVVEGEAELIMDEIFSCFSGIISGISVDDLDRIPFPDRSILINYSGPAPMMAMRGCPYNCSFCSKTFSRKVRFRSPENIVEELRTVSNSEVIFYDENFTTDFDWVEKLCHSISKSGIRKKFRCSTRADRINFEIARMLKSVGFDEVCIGVESGSQKILDILEKKMTVEQNTKARKICQDVGLKFKAYIMLGCPGEDSSTLKETYDWIFANRPDKIGLYMYTPLPGSLIWERSSEYDIEFNKLEYDRTFYGGKRDEIMSSVSTRSLSKRQITLMYWKMLDDFKSLL